MMHHSAQRAALSGTSYRRRHAVTLSAPSVMRNGASFPLQSLTRARSQPIGNPQMSPPLNPFPATVCPQRNIPVRGSISVGRCDARAKSPLGGFIIRDRVQPLRGCGKIRGRQYLQICDPYRSRGGIRCRRFPQICPPDGFQSITNAIVGRPLGLRAESQKKFYACDFSGYLCDILYTKR